MGEVVSLTVIGDRRRERAWYALENAGQRFCEAFLEYQTAYGRDQDEPGRFQIAAATLHGATGHLAEMYAVYNAELERCGRS